MTLAILFWILFSVGFIFHGYRERGAIVDSLFWWVLIFILGLGVFNFPVTK
jgi:hypothetical protein